MATQTTTTYIEAGSSAEAINKAIRATQPGETIIFAAGDYVLDDTIHLLRNRYIRISHCDFSSIPPFDGPYIEMEPKPPQT